MSRELKLLQAIGDIKDEYLEESFTQSVKRPIWMRSLAPVASLILVCGIGGFALTHIGGNATSDGASASDNAAGFSDYQGPILPLTMAEENDSITATREIDLLFRQIDDAPSARSALINDRYTLTNTSEVDQTVTLYYPSATTFSDWLAEDTPTISLDNMEVDTTDYLTGFEYKVDQWFSDGEFAPYLYDLTEFEEYQQLLTDNEPFTDTPPLMDQIVTLYSFTDFGEAIDEYPAATVKVSFDTGSPDPTILAYGFTGGWYDPESTEQARSFDVPDEYSQNDTVYLVSLNGALDLTIQTYQDGGCNTGEEVDWSNMTITETELSLDKAFDLMLQERAQRADESYHNQTVGQLGLLYQAFIEHATGQDLYAGMVEEYSNFALHADRVLYQAVTTTIEAGQSVSLLASLPKQASANHHGGGDITLRGYEIATTLDSVLTFTDCTLSLQNTEGLLLADSNTTLNLADGNTKTSLDTTTDHYYLTLQPAE